MPAPSSPPLPAGRAALASIARAAFWTFTVLALPLGLLGIAAYFTSSPAFLAQLSPFRLQAAALLTAHIAFCLVLHRGRWALLFGLIAAFNYGAVARSQFPGRINTFDPRHPPLKILYANVLTSNPDPARLLALIAAEKPDLVALLEINTRWLSVLSPALATEYPFSSLHPREDNFGLALFSRLQPQGGRVEFFADVETPSYDFTLPASSGPIRILLTHPLPPGDAEGTALRDQHLADLVRWAAFVDTLRTPSATPVPALILGDFNATPWCPPLRRLLAASRLRPAARGHVTVAPTWPVAIPFLRIPLDHALLNDALVCTSYRIGPDIGSDHFPLLLEVRPAAGVP